MKIACDKCNAVTDSYRHDYLKVSTENSTFFLCKECAYGFWQAVDSGQPKIQKPKSP